MMKTKIETLWEILENDASFQTGILLRRYSAEVKPDLYVAIKNAEKLRCLAFRVSNDFEIKTINADKLKEIKVEIITDQTNKAKKLLLFVLLTPLHTDIFAVLCEDLIQAVAHVENENTLLKILKQRFTKWQNLFEKLSNAGLSANEQKGFFGELYLLKILLENLKNPVYVLETWCGMLASPQDFYGQNQWAIEVKTTHVNTEKLGINNEFQLDETIFENLFLSHISLKNNEKQGQNLNNLVAIIFDLLQNNTLATQLFKQKLLDAGYYDLHKNLYENTFYELIATDFYVVKGEFPRLIPAHIHAGITNTKYQISLNQCQKYTISQQQVLEILQQYL